MLWYITYVAGIDDLASISARGGKIGERVRRDGAGRGLETAGYAGAARTTGASLETASATESSAKASTASAESSTATEAATKSTAHAATESSTAAEAHTWPSTSIAVLSNLENSALPIIAVELLDGIAGVVGALKDNDTGALGATVGTSVDISTDNSAVAS